MPARKWVIVAAAMLLCLPAGCCRFWDHGWNDSHCNPNCCCPPANSCNPNCCGYIPPKPVDNCPPPPVTNGRP
jgi:hypothetical protein